MIRGRVREAIGGEAVGGEDSGGVHEGAGVGADGKRGELETARVCTANRNPVGDSEFDRPRDRDRDSGGIIHLRRPTRRRRHSISGPRKYGFCNTKSLVPIVRCSRARLNICKSSYSRSSKFGPSGSYSSSPSGSSSSAPASVVNTEGNLVVVAIQR